MIWRLGLVLLLLGVASQAHAYAVRVSCANKNVTDADGWCSVDNTSTTGSSFSDSEVGNTELGTSYACSAAFQWAATAPTVDAVAVKVANRAASPGTYTFTVCLNSSATGANCGAGDNTGREATLLASDLQNLQSLNQGWVMVKLAASMTPTTATSYYVCAKESNANADVTLYRTTSTTSDWSRMLRTTTTGQAAAGDQLHVIGDWPSDTQTAYTMTINTNDTTSYGQLEATLPQGVTVGKGGTLTYSSAASTTSQFKFKGVLAVFSGGVFNIGTCTNRDYSGGCSTFIPSTSTATLTFDSSGASGDAGISVFSGGIVNMYGSNSPSIVWDTLGADAANGDTTITTTSSTGWLSGDEIAIASTSRTATDAEMKALTGNCSGTSCAITALSAPATTSMCNTTCGSNNCNHCGVAPTQAHIGRLTRNVKINGTDSTHGGYIYAAAGSQVVMRYVESKWMGSNIALKRGMSIYGQTCTTTPCFDIQYSSLHDNVSTGWSITNGGGSTIGNFTISNNVFYGSAQIPIYLVAITSTTYTIDSNLAIGAGAGARSEFTLSDIGGTITNNIVTSSSASGINLQESAALGTFSGNVAYANSYYGIVFSMGLTGTASNLVAWRHAYGGLSFTPSSAGTPHNLIINSPTLFGNAYAIELQNGSGIVVNGGTLNADAKFSGNGLNQGNNKYSVAGITFNSVVTSVAAGSGGNARTALTNDVAISTTAGLFEVLFNNCTLSASTTIANQTSMPLNSSIGFQRFNTTAGDHRLYVRDGTLTTDTTNYYTASPALRLTPNSNSSSTERLQSGQPGKGEKCTPIANGTKVTPTVHVCLIDAAADYNGLAPRLMRVANQALYGSGDTSDEVIATGTTNIGTCVGTGGTGWQTLSGPTAANTTDDGVACFYVDVTGTTGYAVVDDWSVQ